MGKHVLKEHKQLVYKSLFETGVLIAKKDSFAKEHATLHSVPNLDVFLLMRTLVSQKCVTETFSWSVYYWTLTDEGISSLRKELGIPADVIPATLKKTSKNIGISGDMKGSLKHSELDKDRMEYNQSTEPLVATSA